MKCFAPKLPVMLLLTVLQPLSAFAQPYSSTPPELVSIGELKKQLIAALENAPGDAMALYRLGQLHCFAYAYDRKYFPDFTQAADLSSARDLHELPGIPRHTASLLLPLPQRRLNHLADAIIALRECVEIAPEHAGARLALGYAYGEAAKRCDTGKWLHKRVPYDENAAKQLGERVYWENLALEQFRVVRRLEAALQQQGNQGASDGHPRRRYTVSAADQAIFQILCEREPLNSEELAELEELTPTSRTADVVVPPKTLAEMEAAYPQPMPSQNAAQYYLHAADAEANQIAGGEYPLPFVGSLELNMPPQPFSETTRALMERYLRYNEESLRLIHEAASFPQSRYPIDLSLGYDVELDHLARLRHLTRLSALQALYAADTQNAPGATEALLDSLAIGQSLIKEPVLISQLVRRACGVIALDAMEQALSRTILSESELGQLQAAVAQLDDMRSIIVGLEGENWISEFVLAPFKMEEALKQQAERRGIYQPGFGDVPIPQPDVPGEDMETQEERFRAFYEIRRAQFQDMNKKRLTRSDNYLAHARLGVEALQELVKLPADFDPQNPAASLERYEDKEDPAPAVRRSITAFVRYTTRLRVTQSALAAQRFERLNGEWPITLDILVPDYLPAASLIDPYTGESLKSLLTEDRYVVYSVADAMVNERARMDGREGPSGISFTVAW